MEKGLNWRSLLLLLSLSLPFFLSALKDQRIREQAESRNR